MHVAVRLPGALRPHATDAATVAIEIESAGATVAAVLDALASDHPEAGRRIRDERGALRRHVNVFLGRGDDFERVALDTPVPPDTELVVLPAVSGGALARPTVSRQLS